MGDIKAIQIQWEAFLRPPIVCRLLDKKL